MSCPLCGGHPLPFWAVSAVPTSSCTVFETAESARAQPIGDLSLAVCPECGLIINETFDGSAVDYRAPYEESQAGSPTFRQFAEETIARLLSRYPLAGGRVLDIGCGKAEWLAMICRAGEMTGVGIDPAYVPGRVPAEAEERFEVIADFFGPDLDLTGDLVACRHTLEHVPNTAEFGGWLRDAAARTGGSVVFLEVPDTGRILSEGAFWDVYYEHCVYFTTTSMDNLAGLVGLSVHELSKGYADQYLMLEAAPDGTSRPPVDPETTVESALAFGERADESIETWRRRLAMARRNVLWGATSKTVAFISALGSEPEAVVDINPAKQGTYLPGSGVPIITPAQLGDIDADLVVAMNPIYLDEIHADLDRMEVGAELTALGYASP